MKQIVFVTVLLIGFYFFKASAQSPNTNNVCSGAYPFCTGTIYSFPAGVNAGTAQTGPYYGCLTTRPNPAWYYMKIALPGMLQIKMYSTPLVDIDFICWGPFDSQEACNSLTSNKVIDCSYSTAAVEYCDIPNAIAGKFYILLITNYSNQPCNITFQKTAGTATTDCSILPPAASSNSPVCVGDTIKLRAANMVSATYNWVGPDGWTSNLQNPNRYNAQLSMGGIYSLFVYVNGQVSDTNTTEVVVVPKPTAMLSGTSTICQGDTTNLTVTLTGSPPWTIKYTVNNGVPVTKAITSSPATIPVSPAATAVYQLVYVSNSSCIGTAMGSATVTVNPRPSTDFNFHQTCSNLPTQFTDASTIGAGNITSWLWNFGSMGNTSNIQNPVYTFPSAGMYNVSLTTTSGAGCSKTKVKIVSINPTPVAEAGNDRTIAYGTNTTLTGAVSGGINELTFTWEPADQLQNPNVLNPVTKNLTQTTDYTLTAVDVVSQCSASDNVKVVVTGGPLGVTVTPDPPAVCPGGWVSLNASVSGGSGVYSYTWFSSPPGFTSTMEDVSVKPSVTTTYTLVVSDGYTNASHNVTVTVWPVPVANAGSDVTIMNGAHTTLSGSAASGTPPFSYVWEPANFVLHPDQPSTETTSLSETTNFKLTVTDSHGCMSTDNVLVTVSGSVLSVSPVAELSPICPGEPTKLIPMASGGSGVYTYQWQSQPAGLNSTLQNPIVSPRVTTTYTVTVNDGYNSRTGSFTLIVNPEPTINLIPPGSRIVGKDSIMVCIFDTVVLKSAAPDQVYYWSNGSTAESIMCTTSGIAFDMQSYTLHVTNTLTGCSHTDTITVLFAYSQCAYGFDQNSGSFGTVVIPNPASNKIRLKYDNPVKPVRISMYEISGRKVSDKSYYLIDEGPGYTDIEITALAKGMYLVKIERETISETLKFVKR